MKINIAFFIIFIICLPVVTQAEISVRDNWSVSGKLTVEGSGWSAVFSKEEAGVKVYSNEKEAIKIVPFYSEKANAITSCKKTETGIEAIFSAGQNQIEGRFSFDEDGAIQIEPLLNMKGIIIFGPMDFGIIPNLPLEDLIYDPEKFSSADQLYLPSENVFMGLLRGEEGLFFCAWPPGNQEVKLLGSNDAINAFEIKLDGQSIYLKAINTAGIWHREELKSDYLERDVEIEWKRPFSANWKTQILEGDIETAFPFISWKERKWRPNFGFYQYPAWFNNEKTFFSFSKKCPPPKQALIYALEGSKNTPLDFARAKLGIIPTIKPKTGLQRYPTDNVGIQNCDGRAWVKWLFKVNYQTREKEFLQEVMQDFLYSINIDKGRLEEYESFIPELKAKISSWIEKEKGNSEIEPFLRQMKERVEELEKEYWDKMNNSPASKHLEAETEAINKLKVLIEQNGPEFYPEACYLLDKILLWSDIEAVPGRVGGLLRAMSQQAGYGSMNNSDIIKYAREIRRDIRKFIINGETHETVY